jgi:hypothetical protein
MKDTVAVLTLAVFAVLALVLAVGSLAVIFDDAGQRQTGAATTTATTATCADPTPCQMPAPPEIPPAPMLTDTAFTSQQVSIYQHQVTAYDKRVAAYEKYLETWSSQRAKGPDRLARYQAVVKDALLPILSPLVAAFIAFAFAKGTANIVRNVLAARRQVELTDLKL